MIWDSVGRVHWSWKIDRILAKRSYCCCFAAVPNVLPFWAKAMVLVDAHCEPLKMKIGVSRFWLDAELIVGMRYNEDLEISSVSLPLWRFALLARWIKRSSVIPSILPCLIREEPSTVQRDCLRCLYPNPLCRRHPLSLTHTSKHQLRIREW